MCTQETDYKKNSCLRKLDFDFCAFVIWILYFRQESLVMSWVCDECGSGLHELVGQDILCLSCGITSVNNNSESGKDTERHKSYDKKRIKLKGAALKSKQIKAVNNLEPEDEGRVDTEDLKSNPTNVYIASAKDRSRKAGSIKLRVQKDLLRLSNECGYSVELTCTAPKPGGGRRGEPLSLSLRDMNGERAKCSCRHEMFSCDCSNKAEAVDTGTQVSVTAMSGSKVLTPSKVRQLKKREQLGLSLISPIYNSGLRKSIENEQNENETTEDIYTQQTQELQQTLDSDQETLISEEETLISQHKALKNQSKQETPNSQHKTLQSQQETLISKSIEILKSCQEVNKSHQETSAFPTSPETFSFEFRKKLKSLSGGPNPKARVGGHNKTKAGGITTKIGDSRTKTVTKPGRSQLGVCQPGPVASNSKNKETGRVSDQVKPQPSKPTFQPPNKEESCVKNGNKY